MNRVTTMNTYVGVSNDVSLAIKSILNVKKAFRSQMKCMEELTEVNKSLQQQNRQLEKRKSDLEKKIMKLECYNEKQEQVMSDIFGEYNAIALLGDGCNVDNNASNPSHIALASAHVDNIMQDASPNPKEKNKQMCPASPTKSNTQGCKRKVTPMKSKLPRKSRRLSKRERKTESLHV